MLDFLDTILPVLGGALGGVLGFVGAHLRIKQERKKTQRNENMEQLKTNTTQTAAINQLEEELQERKRENKNCLNTIQEDIKDIGHKVSKVDTILVRVNQIEKKQHEMAEETQANTKAVTKTSQKLEDLIDNLNGFSIKHN